MYHIKFKLLQTNFKDLLCLKNILISEFETNKNEIIKEYGEAFTNYLSTEIEKNVFNPQQFISYLVRNNHIDGSHNINEYNFKKTINFSNHKIIALSTISFSDLKNDSYYNEIINQMNDFMTAIIKSEVKNISVNSISNLNSKIKNYTFEEKTKLFYDILIFYLTNELKFRFHFLFDYIADDCKFHSNLNKKIKEKKLEHLILKIL
jgi:hypothetical protein